MTHAKESRLADVLAILRHEALSARQVREALASAGTSVSPATAYSYLAALEGRGDVRSRKRRRHVPGKSGQRERVYEVED